MDLTEMKNKKRKNKKRNKTLWPLFRNSWYSSYQPWNDERVSQTWSHLVVLNMGPLDWNTGLLNCKNLDISRTKHLVFPVWNICRKFHFASMNVSKVIAWRKLKKSQDFWNFNSTKVNSTFHPSEVDKMSTRSFQEVSGKK